MCLLDINDKYNFFQIFKNGSSGAGGFHNILGKKNRFFTHQIPYENELNAIKIIPTLALLSGTKN